METNNIVCRPQSYPYQSCDDIYYFAQLVPNILIPVIIVLSTLVLFQSHADTLPLKVHLRPLPSYSKVQTSILVTDIMIIELYDQSIPLAYKLDHPFKHELTSTGNTQPPGENLNLTLEGKQIYFRIKLHSCKQYTILKLHLAVVLKDTLLSKHG